MTEGKEEKVEALKIPEVEYHNAKHRFLIIMTMILTALIIGFPCWYLTTSVERGTLPIDEITELNELYLNNIHYKIGVEIIEFPNLLNGLIDELQEDLDTKLANSNVLIKLFKGEQSDPISKTNYKLKLIMNEFENKIILDNEEDKLIRFYFNPEIIKNNALIETISTFLINDLFQYEIENGKTNDRISFPFSPKYKLSINLLHSGSKILSDSKKELLFSKIKQFKTTLMLLESYCKFDVEFQELWYEERKETAGEYEDGEFTIIKDPSMLIDYSDWGLDQDVELNSIINLNLYIPEDEKLLIQNSHKNSFIIPQWGSFIILNQVDEKTDFNEIFEVFSYHLLKLIGIRDIESSSIFFNINEKMRIQTLNNLKDSLLNFKSLIKLSNQMDTIPIPSETVNDINSSIGFFKESIELIDSIDWQNAYVASISALQLSNKAFFHKDMVQQAYFPEEHKLAVYSPLLGPLLTIVFMATVKVIKELRQ